ncbi:hypothetical protein [Pseudorhodoferax sp. Leaf267]|uniref:hypothetical protein n=1 Tax=Pseudorhodoferax sp. Leaf267 TaxID=1736316 RepID=UPI0006FF6EB2|nr:hypothetical protein [Pseudorhodoferax sp. Leaf267]KQP18113.1 hypothetical protein ASF43_09720 [Pseudorhodoferax sp. Leaf267]
MQDLFEMDWSFIVVVVSVTILMVVLAVRSRVLKRRRRREEKARASRAYREWLANSNMQPLEPDAPQATKRHSRG